MIEFSNEKPVDTKLIRLRSGELLIACMQEYDTSYVLEKPMSVSSVPMMDQKGMVRKVGVYLKDWIDYTDDTYFVISKDIVLVTAAPDKKMLADYHEAKMHSDMQRAEIELAETMQEYLQQVGKMEVPQDERDTGDENDYNSPEQDSTEEEEKEEYDDEEEEEDEDDEDDGLPWLDGKPRVRF